MINKPITMVIAVLLTAQALAQSSLKTYTLRGHLTGAHKDSVFIDYSKNALKSTIISRPFVNGSFTITGKISGPTRVLIYFQAGENKYQFYPMGKFKEIFLEPGLLMITGNIEKPDSLILTGSKSQQELEEWNQLTALARKAKNGAIHGAMIQNDLERVNQGMASIKFYQDKVNTISYAFFLKHPNSYVTAFKLLKCADRMSLDSIKRIYNSFNNEMRKSGPGKVIAGEIKRIEATLPGREAVDFSMPDFNGTIVSIKGQKGRYTILDFADTWNDISRQSDKHLLLLYRKYQPKGLTIISLDENGFSGPYWKKAIEQDSTWVWPHVTQRLTQSDVFKQYHVYALPTKILIDPDGRIIGRFGDYDPQADNLLDRQLAAIFKQ